MVLILRLKVVPNVLVQSLFFEASILDATCDLRITHQNCLETGTKVYYSFRRVICISSDLS